LTFQSAGQDLEAFTKLGHPYFRPVWRPDIVGMFIDSNVDWSEIREILTESYCLVAPKNSWHWSTDRLRSSPVAEGGGCATLGEMDESNASRTAVLVCQGRAAADGRIDAGRFDDPTAFLLLTEEERDPVEIARSGIVPQGFGERLDFERLAQSPRSWCPEPGHRRSCHCETRSAAGDPRCRARRTGMAIERARRRRRVRGRPPDVAGRQAVALDRLELTARSIRFVPVDFSRDSLADALAAAGHDRTIPTTWIWEGDSVSHSDQVQSSVAVISQLSALESRLVINYQSRSLSASIGRRLTTAVAKLSGSNNPMATSRGDQRGHPTT
jgi:hypothetical protein